MGGTPPLRGYDVASRIPAIQIACKSCRSGELRTLIPQAPETIEQNREAAEPRSDAPGAQEGARRPWWRRVFGG